MLKIKKGDQVVVIAGRDKGKHGLVKQRVSDALLIVEGVNLVKKHVKPNPNKGEAGGIIPKEAVIHQSNVAIFNPQSGKSDKVVIKTESGKKIRVYRSNGEKIEIQSVKV